MAIPYLFSIAVPLDDADQRIAMPTDCHYHYSTRFAVKCVGCETAILKQFVEMNRNGRNECWHPECYMISKVTVFDLHPNRH